MSAVLQHHQSEAQFDRTESALRFAFRQARENYSLALMNRLATTVSIPDGTFGLSGLDGAGAAGIIGRHVQALGETAAAILAARYTPREEKCDCGRSCCKGYKISEYWQDRIGVVVRQIRGCISGMSNYRYVYGATSKYFGAKVNLGDLQTLCQISEKTAPEHNQKIRQFLQKNEGAAFHAVAATLREAGIVAS